MILFTADWHIKLGQKNVPMAWACSRYKLFFEILHQLEENVDLHIIGGDLFDRVPSMDEITLYKCCKPSETNGAKSSAKVKNS